VLTEKECVSLGIFQDPINPLVQKTFIPELNGVEKKKKELEKLQKKMERLSKQLQAAKRNKVEGLMEKEDGQ
jgi:uncharacterized coiled-coil protein SlyX